MKNVTIKTDSKGIMTITVDTNKEFGLSKSGKTLVIASTMGNKPEGDIFVGLNVYKYAGTKK